MGSDVNLSSLGLQGIMQQDRFPVQIVDEFLVPLPQHLPIISEFERVAVNVVDASDEIL